MRRLLLSCLFLLPLPAYCWWETGHQVVARIAVMHLTPDALRRVAHILDVENTPEAVSDALAQASLWADETKKDTNTGNWHYIDLTLQDQKSDIAARCDHDNCVTARLRQFAGQLASKSPIDSRWSDLDALRYVVHFVGDIHQPLHDISNADQGGNCEVLDPPVVNAKNLHALWDGELVNVLGTNDKSLTADLSREIDAMPPARQAELAAGNQDDWVWEGHQLAEKEIYTRLGIPREAVAFPGKCSEAPTEITGLKLEIEPSYIEAMKPVVRGQLEKAGLRLARLLNDSLAPRD
jgi:S1/P1 Nuclease